MSDFDDKAATWDDDPAKVERARRVADRVRTITGLESSLRLLEYGAGTGLVTQAMGAAVVGATLADTSAGMRAVIQDKIDAGVLAEGRVWDLDLAAEPPPVERFDVIVTVLTLHHIVDVHQVLHGFAAMLDAGGWLCIADLDAEDGSFHGDGHHGHDGFDRAALASELEAAGFTDVRFEHCGTVPRHDAEYPMFLATARRGE